MCFQFILNHNYITLRVDFVFTNHSTCNICKINSTLDKFLFIYDQYFPKGNILSENMDLTLFKL
jgi:hypothetical protein